MKRRNSGALDGSLPEIAECGLCLTSFFRMECQLFVMTMQAREALSYCPNGGAMDFSALVARHRVRAGLGDNLVSKTRGIAYKRMDKCKSLELEQRVQ